MSRIGKQPVSIPSGVKTTLGNGTVSIQGPKGALTYTWGAGVEVKTDDKQILVSMIGSDRQAKANYGTTRAHIGNMVKGVTTGWKRALDLNGVGFTAKLNGKKLVLATGYSHDVEIVIPDGIACKAEKTRVELEGSDKDLVGSLAASIRRVCPPEPYLGKGIKYDDEQVRRKAGKTGKK